MVGITVTQLGELHRRFVVWEATALLRHDLRNKLASVRNAGFYLRRKVEAGAPALWQQDPRLPTFFDLIGSELTGAEALISSRLPSIGEPPPLESVDLVAVIDDAIAATAVPAGVTVVFDARRDDVPALGNHAELVLAVWCLLDNAIEAAAGGEVRIQALRDDRGAVIEIDDDGPGPPPEDQAMQPFFTTRPGRLGLGVNVVKRIAGRGRATFTLCGGDAPTGAKARLVLGSPPGAR